MAAGGIYDHLGGGFARYSTDGRWLVPHFEKMLYDQALLARVYLHAWQVTGEPRYRQILDETIGYVLRDLRHPLGGFFSAEDADSEGVEGKFYVWSLDEVRAVAGADADAAIEWYGVTAGGNWEGTNILERPVRGDLLRPEAVERARAALFAERETSASGPGLDDKVLTEWNALMLATLAEAAAATGDAEWAAAAVANAEFLLRRAAAGRRPVAAHVAGPGRRRGRGRRGQDPRLRRRPRRAGRRLRAPGRAHRRGPLARRGPHRRPTRWSSCSGTTRPAACSPPAPTPRRW